MKVPKIATAIVFCLLFTVPPVTILLLRALHVRVTDDVVLSVLNQYDELSTIALGWFEPYVAPVLSRFRGWMNWDLVLHAHWKYVFQLMFIYFSADAKTAWNTGRSINSIVMAVSGGLIALVVSVFSGLFDPLGEKFIGSLAIGGAPIVGYTIYALIAAVTSGIFSRAKHAADAGLPKQSFGEFVGSRAKRALLTMLFGLAILFVGILVLVSAFPELKNPGLPMLIVLVFLLGANWVTRGISQVYRKFESSGGPTVSDILGMANVRLGAGMMGTIVGAIGQVALLWVVV